MRNLKRTLCAAFVVAVPLLLLEQRRHRPGAGTATGDVATATMRRASMATPTGHIIGRALRMRDLIAHAFLGGVAGLGGAGAGGGGSGAAEGMGP